MGGLAVLPLVRGSDTVREVGTRVAVAALAALVVGLLRGWPSLVTAALVLVGGIYAGQLVADDVPLDVAAPAFAAGTLVAAELAYWSIDERTRALGERGDGLRRLGWVAGLGVATLVAAAVLLAVADAVRARGLGVDVAGAAAAALALLAAVLLALRRGPSSA